MECNNFQLGKISEYNFLLGFLGVPISYSDLKELKNNINILLNNFSEEHYNNIREQLMEQYFPSQKDFDSYCSSPEAIAKRKAKLEKEIKKIELIISKPILEQKRVEEYIKKMKIIDLNDRNKINITYPALVSLMKNKKHLKIIRCSKNLKNTLEQNINKFDFDSFSFVTIPEKHIEQVYEHFIVTRNPVLNNKTFLKQLGGVLITSQNVRKYIKYHYDYQITSNKIIEIALMNGLDVYTPVNGQTYLNSKEIFNYVYRYLRTK